MKVSYITYSHNGMANQFCSLQLLAALAGTMPSQAIEAVYHTREWTIQDPQGETHNFVKMSDIDKKLNLASNPTLLDLVEFSMPNVTFYKNDLHFEDRLNSNIIKTQQQFINANGLEENVREFAYGRVPVVLDEDKHNIFTMTLKWYSLFIKDRPKTADDYIKSLNFKQEYLALAQKIKNHLGDFNGAHIRVMPDHFNYYTFDKGKFSQGLSSFIDNSLPLYASIDRFDSPLLKEIEQPFTGIHDVILNDFYSDFSSLPYSNRVVLGLISNLVMSLANDFVGSPLSTFTGLIHQTRHRNSLPSFKFFPGVFDEYNIDAKPYSWNSLRSREDLGWQREFGECYING
jgi:hypothetical protein